jgi:hypothetical protein
LARPLVIVLGAVFILLAPSGISQEATSSGYRQEIIDGQEGRPLLQLTNKAALPITAYVVVLAPYEGGGIEGRTYHDSCTSRREQPIASGQSARDATGYYVNSEFKMARTEVQAAVFEDGSTAGNPSWIDAVLARRLRFYDRLTSLRDLLNQQIGISESLSSVIEKLRSAQASTDKEPPDDDLRVMDDTAFTGAISTVQANTAHSVDDLLRTYVKHLEDQTAQISRCQPSLNDIRSRLANRPNSEKPIDPPPFKDSR